MPVSARRDGEPAGERVAVVVVTHNRRDLLRTCLEAVVSQDRRPDLVIVVDNASSDGTAEVVRREYPTFELLSLERNEGGAGGFHAGLLAAHRRGADWTWLLDDDAIARSDSLRMLLDSRDRLDGLPRPSLLASRVDWRDGRPHPMNMPIVRRRDGTHLVKACRAGLVPLRAASFVSMLVSRAAVDHHGLPCRHYFFQADDIEYTARVLRDRWGYMVPESVVEHRTAKPHTAFSDGGHLRFYHHARNTVFMLRGRAWTRAEKPALLWTLVRTSAEYLRGTRFSRESWSTLARALRDGARR